MKDIIRWWFEADLDLQFGSMLGAGGALVLVLFWSGAVVAMLCGWQPWAR